jgi:hypothetical protein
LELDILGLRWERKDSVLIVKKLIKLVSNLCLEKQKLDSYQIKLWMEKARSSEKLMLGIKKIKAMIYQNFSIQIILFPK